MSWNYRIVRRHQDGHTWLALHEVYYHADRRPQAMTVDPAQFVADADEGEDGIVRALEMALADATRHPILDEATELPSLPGPAAHESSKRSEPPSSGAGRENETANYRPLAMLDRLMDAKAGTREAEFLGDLATAIEDRENLLMKLGQLYQAIGHLAGGGAASEAEWQRLLDYAADGSWGPDFLPWPRRDAGTP